jgi:hypothetical protein
VYIYIIFIVLWMESRALCMGGNCSTTEVYPHRLVYFEISVAHRDDGVLQLVNIMIKISGCGFGLELIEVFHFAELGAKPGLNSC